MAGSRQSYGPWWRFHASRALPPTGKYGIEKEKLIFKELQQVLIENAGLF
jgi:hypothetical protein